MELLAMACFGIWRGTRRNDGDVVSPLAQDEKKARLAGYSFTLERVRQTDSVNLEQRRNRRDVVLLVGGNHTLDVLDS